MSDLNHGWPTLPLGQIASEMCLGKMLDKQKNSGTHHPYLRNMNVRWLTFDLSDLKEMKFEQSELNRFSLKHGDLVVCEGGEPGRSAVWKGQTETALIQKALHRIRFRHDLYDPDFAMYFLHYGSLTNQFTNYYTGSTIKHLTGASLSKVPFPIAPVSLQRRIVAKIEELLSELDAGVAALKRVQANLKRYRSAVLKAAVEGRLTEAWRAEHQPHETGSQLLASILKERRNKWEADQLASFAAAGKTPPKGWQARYKEPAAPDTSDLPSLPKSWCWSTLDAIADVTGGLTKDAKRASEKDVQEVPYLRVANVQRGYLDLSEIKTIHASQSDVAALRLLAGDILFNEGGDRDKLGRGWVWSGEIENCIHQNHVFRARLLSTSVQPTLVSHHGNGFGKKWFTKAGKQTTNLASINLGMLRQFPVPLAPADEQAEIVRLLEECLAPSEVIEQETKRDLARSDRLRQSILKQAFEGKLVPQDPTDEPASVLLARIRQQRTAPSATSSSPAAKPKKVSKDVFVRRAAIVSYIVNRLANRRSFGRTQLEKTLHLAQSHLGLELQFAFERYKAGPFDKDIYKIEGVAKKQGWFTKDEPANGKVTYHPGNKIDQMCQSAIRQLADKRAAFDGLLDHIAGMTTDDAELFATAYAAWNDLLIDGRTADDAAIVAEVHGWHEQKKRFTPTQIQSRLTWMRKCGYVPTGKGERTRLASPAKTKRRAKSP